MIPIPSGVRVWLATGHTDMRKGWASLALQVQERLGQDPHGGHLFIFRGRRGDLVKVIWHDGQGGCLFMKRLERGRFLWPSAVDGAVSILTGQMAISLRGSTGAIPGRAGRRRPRADCDMMNQGASARPGNCHFRADLP
jgi:transposase